MSILTHIWTITAHILPFLFVLSLLVFFHELGHFFIGRWFGVKVVTSSGCQGCFRSAVCQ
jgi:hypothetical protein